MDGKKPTKRRNALGRGLGALLDDSSGKDSSRGQEFNVPRTALSEAGVNEISIEFIEVNPYQPRTDFNQEALQELSESIKVQGIIQPITVRRLGRNQYQLISGERRLQASKLAGLTKIPAYVRSADDQQMVEMALIENIQREDLNAMEIALSYQRLLTECNLKQEELGERVGKNRSTVNNYLRLLKLPPDIQVALRDGKLSMGHARAIVNIENAEAQLDIYKRTLNEELSVRKVEAMVRDYMNKSSSAPRQEKASNPELNNQLKQVETRLSSHFGTKVAINHDAKNKGKIQIPFASAEDLNRILEILNY